MSPGRGGGRGVRPALTHFRGCPTGEHESLCPTRGLARIRARYQRVASMRFAPLAVPSHNPCGSGTLHHASRCPNAPARESFGIRSKNASGPKQGLRGVPPCREEPAGSASGGGLFFALLALNHTLWKVDRKSRLPQAGAPLQSGHILRDSHQRGGFFCFPPRRTA